VLHPQKGDWLYFVTVNKAGLTKFSATQAGIQVYDNEAQRNGLG
jgi:cell division protein YceG involved in septum cleavage